MGYRVKAIRIFAFLLVTTAVAAEEPVDLSGKWALKDSAQSFQPSAPMQNVGPSAGPTGGGSVDVRTGGDGEYRGGEGRMAGRNDNYSAPDLVLAIAQTATEIKLERKWTQDGQPLISHETFMLDGKDNIVRDEAGRVETKSKAKWRKDVLRIDSVHQVRASGRTVEVRVRQDFSLSEDGQELGIKTTQEIPNGQVVIRQTFRKS